MKKRYIVLVGLVLVAGCGSSIAGTAQPQAAQTAGGARQRQGPPGTSGLLAALSGNTLQVQSRTAQTAVTYSSATTFTDTVKVTAADVAVGSCVLVRSGDTSTGSSPPAAPATKVTAASVSVSAPVDGSCTGGFGGASGPGRVRPSGAPNGPPPGGFSRGGTPPSGVRGPGRGFAAGAFGKVVSKGATGFVLQSIRPGATTSPTTQQVTVTTSATTTYTASRKATAAALKVGKCVTARGSADSSGTVAATAISIRPATNGACANAGGPGA